MKNLAIAVPVLYQKSALLSHSFHRFARAVIGWHEGKKEGIVVENATDREFARRLRSFETVWRRVSAAKAPRETAEKLGVKLMPRQSCRRRCGRK
jgi:hypothetical protein